MAIGAYGKKPEVPSLATISPGATQKATVGGNIASFADIARLATSVNTFNQDQLNALIDRALGPGARAQIQETLGSQLRGEIPLDVQRAMYRGNAERNAGRNAFGGNFNANIDARSLGLLSLDITNKALSSAESWISRAVAPQFDVTSMFFTPQQRLAFEQQQQGMQFQRDLLAAGVKAAPDPGMAALAQGFDQEMARTENAIMSMGGKMMGGGLGGGGGGLGGSSPPYNASEAAWQAG